MISTANFMAKAREIADLLQERVGGRPYRYEGERASQLDQLRETEVSLSMMATAGEDPDRARMATDIEDGAESRLTVLLGKPRLTLLEKRERDAIQRALRERRQGFAGSNADVTTPRRFLPAIPIAANPLIAILLSPWTLVVFLAAFALVQMGLKERIEDQRDEARADAARFERSRDSYAQALGQERAAHAEDVAQVLEDTATTVEQMRVQAQRRAAREARERARREDLARGTVNFGERLRELARPEDAGLPADPAAAPSGDPAGAMPTGAGGDADNGAHR